MNKAKKEPFTKFKKCLFLVVFLLSLNNISGQSSENYLPYMIYNIKCNTYNALYYGRENEITIKYDTVMNTGDILLDLDTAFFKKIVRVNKYKYTFFLDDNEEFACKNLIRDKSLHAYYLKKDKKFRLHEKKVLLIDTNTWHANLIFDNLFIFDDYVSGDNLVTFLQKIIKKDQNNDLVRIVKNDKIVNEYKQLNYCVSAFSRFSNRYNKLCYDSELNKSGGAIVEFLRFINCWSPIFIENIEVIELNGNTIFFPPMSFHIHPDWHIRIP